MNSFDSFVVRQFAQSGRPNPTRRLRISLLNSFGGFDGEFTQIQIAFSDLSERPIDGFFDVNLLNAPELF